MNETQSQRAKAGSHIVLTALVDSRGLVRVRVEQRDYQYRLVSRADREPLSAGGPDFALLWGRELWQELIEDYLTTYATALGSEDDLNTQRGN